MHNLESALFTNQHRDSVDLALLADSFGGFHLIVKVKRTRLTAEKRVVNGALTDIPVNTFTSETTHKQFTDKRTALVEFKMECMTNGLPGFGVTEFQNWLIATNTEKSN